MFITKKYLDRRTFLKGLGGVGVALPFLDAMVPAAASEALARPQLRAVFIYTPHGAIPGGWVPKEAGAGYTMTPILAPLEPFREQMLVISNLAMNPKSFLGSGHSGASATWLSGSAAKDTGSVDIEAGTTINQMIARKIGLDTPFPSLELGIEDSNLIGTCDGAVSCSYINSVSWRTPTTPLPVEINPRAVFEIMFGDGSSPGQRIARLHLDRSLLDSITSAAMGLKRELSGVDRARVSDYLDNVREVERRVAIMEQRAANIRLDIPDAPVEMPQVYEEHVKLMFDMQLLALQTDVTRVTSFMMSRELNMRTYPHIGVPEQHHAVSHHGNNPAMIEKCVKINKYHVSLFADFVGKLANTRDGAGSLLDHTMILYGSGMGDSNFHAQNPMSNIVVGGAAGRLKGGKHLPQPPNTPMANLLLALLNVADVEAESIGNSTGVLSI